MCYKMARRMRFTAEQLAQIFMVDDENESDVHDATDEEDNIEINSEEEDVVSNSDEDNDYEEQDEEDTPPIRGRSGYSWSEREPYKSSYRGRNNITMRPGLLPPTENLDTKCDFFNFFFDYTTMKLILDCTNKRLEDEEAEITEEELQGFFGLLIYFGVTKKRDVDVEEIWSPGSIHYSQIAVATMSRTRFQTISRRLTFDDIETRKERLRTRGKFYKMEDVFRRVVYKCKIGFEPYEQLCIDEQLYSFRGKCPFRQYMPSKPARYGLKYWAIVDVKTSYILQADIYLGKEAHCGRAVNIGFNVASKLAQPYFQTNRGITTDNFFSSVSLVDFLWEHGLTFVGTMRKNKKEIPSSFLPNKSKEVNSSQFAFDGYKTLVSYTPKKNKSVILLSTEHHSKATVAAENNKPEIILAYNNCKGGVDTLDKLVRSYSVRRKTMRWTFNCFMYLLDIASYNAFVLHSHKHPTDTSSGNRRRRRFLEDLSQKLTQPCMEERVRKFQMSQFRGVPQNVITAIESCGMHIHRDSKVSDTRNPTQGRCYLCPRSADRKIKTLCANCLKHVCKNHCSIAVLCEKCE